MILILVSLIVERNKPFIVSPIANSNMNLPSTSRKPPFQHLEEVSPPLVNRTYCDRKIFRRHDQVRIFSLEPFAQLV